MKIKGDIPQEMTVRRVLKYRGYVILDHGTGFYSYVNSKEITYGHGIDVIMNIDNEVDK